MTCRLDSSVSAWLALSAISLYYKEITKAQAYYSTPTPARLLHKRRERKKRKEWERGKKDWSRPTGCIRGPAWDVFLRLMRPPRMHQVRHAIQWHARHCTGVECVQRELPSSRTALQSGVSGVGPCFLGVFSCFLPFTSCALLLLIVPLLCISPDSIWYKNRSEIYKSGESNLKISNLS